MPTGYTSFLADDLEATLADFAWRCARAMGACIAQRDEPTDKPPRLTTPSDSYSDGVASKEQELAEVTAMTASEAELASQKEYSKRIADNAKAVLKREKLRSTYERLLAEVRSWEPPTADHQGLKEFMEEQLVSSIEFDCDTEYYRRPIEKLDGKTWKAQRAASLRYELDRMVHLRDDDTERTQKRNAWIKALANSLGKEASY